MEEGLLGKVEIGWEKITEVTSTKAKTTV